MRWGLAVHDISRDFGRSLHRILHRFGVVLVGHLQIVLSGDGLGIADPAADDVCGKSLLQFRLTGGPQVVEEFRPGVQAGPLDDPQQLRPQIGVGVAVAGDNVRGALGAPFAIVVSPMGEVANQPADEPQQIA